MRTASCLILFCTAVVLPGCESPNASDESPLAPLVTAPAGTLCLVSSSGAKTPKQQVVDGVLFVTGTQADDVIDCSGSSYPVNATGGGGSDVMIGSVFDDIMTGGGGDDVMRGGDGADDLSGGGGCDLVDGGAGDDIEVDGGPGDDSATCGGGVLGGAGNDLLNGGPGDDDLDGGDDVDVCNGGGGSDTFTACETANDSRN